MHISRSGLSCCVVSGVTHEALKRFCIVREEALPEEEEVRDHARSHHSEQSIEDGETTPYYTLTPPTDVDLDDTNTPDDITEAP